MEEPGPIDVITRLVTALNACDLESAVALFEPGASFVIKPGFVVNGTRGIRSGIGRFHGTEANANHRLAAGRASRCCRPVLRPMEPERNRSSGNCRATRWSILQHLAAAGRWAMAVPGG